MSLSVQTPDMGVLGTTSFCIVFFGVLYVCIYKQVFSTSTLELNKQVLKTSELILRATFYMYHRLEGGLVTMVRIVDCTGNEHDFEMSQEGGLDDTMWEEKDLTFIRKGASEAQTFSATAGSESLHLIFTSV